MKKYSLLCFALLLALSLAACGSANQAAESASQSAESPADVSVEAERDPADGDQSAVSSAAAISLEPESSAVLAPELEANESDDRASRAYACSVSGGATRSEQAAAEALADVLAAQGDTLTIQTAETAEAQLAQLTELSGTVDAVFLCPVDAEAMAEGLNGLADQGLVIFGFGSWGETLPEGVTATVTFDEYEAGYLCGMDLAEKLEDGGDAAVLTVPGQSASAQRCLGFEDAAVESGAGIEPLEEQECADQEAAKAAVEALLEEEPDLSAVFAGSEELALGALEAAEEAGSACLVYGTDGSPALKARMEDSQLEAIGASTPVELADLLAFLAGQYLDGEDVAASNSVVSVLIDAENLSSYGTEGWQ